MYPCRQCIHVDLPTTVCTCLHPCIQAHASEYLPICWPMPSYTSVYQPVYRCRREYQPTPYHTHQCTLVYTRVYGIPACTTILVYLPTPVYTCLHQCIPAYTRQVVYTGLYTCRITAYNSVYWPTPMYTGPRQCISACMLAYACLHQCMPACIHAYIQSYTRVSAFPSVYWPVYLPTTLYTGLHHCIPAYTLVY